MNPADSSSKKKPNKKRKGSTNPVNNADQNGPDFRSQDEKKYGGIDLGLSYSNMTAETRKKYRAMSDEERAEYNRLTREMRTKQSKGFATSIETTEKTMTAMNGKVDNVDTKVTEVSGKVTAIDGNVTEIHTIVVEDKPIIAQTDQNVREILNALGRLDAKVDEMDNQRSQEVIVQTARENEEKEREKEEAKGYKAWLGEKLSKLGGILKDIVNYFPLLWVLAASIVRGLEELWKNVLLPHFGPTINAIQDVAKKIARVYDFFFGPQQKLKTALNQASQQTTKDDAESPLMQSLVEARDSANAEADAVEGSGPLSKLKRWWYRSKAIKADKEATDLHLLHYQTNANVAVAEGISDAFSGVGSINEQDTSVRNAGDPVEHVTNTVVYNNDVTNNTQINNVDGGNGVIR